MIKIKAEEEAAPKLAEKDKDKATLKPKASGKLDWSKAKKSTEKDKGEKGAKVKEESEDVKMKKSESPAPSKTKKSPPTNREGDESPRDEEKVRIRHRFLVLISSFWSSPPI